MAKIALNNCKEITSAEYCDLSERTDLKFEGQTRANSKGVYWIVWRDGDELLKIKCKLSY